MYDEFTDNDPALRAGTGWHNNSVDRLFGKTCGIVGFGRIGCAVPPEVRGLGMDVVAYDSDQDTILFDHLDVERVVFDDLLLRSDVITTKSLRRSARLQTSVRP